MKDLILTQGQASNLLDVYLAICRSGAYCECLRFDGYMVRFGTTGTLRIDKAGRVELYMNIRLLCVAYGIINQVG